MSIKYAILGLLNYTDMHGYRIKNHLEKNFSYIWTANFGQIYPTLQGLEKDEFITMDLLPSENGGPHKKCYSITDKGRKELLRYLSESSDKPMLVRNPFFIKFAFFGFGRSERALEIIDDQIKMAENELKARKKNVERWNRQGIYVRLLAEFGIDQNENYIKWLRKARREIERSAIENE